MTHANMSPSSHMAGTDVDLSIVVPVLNEEVILKEKMTLFGEALNEHIGKGSWKFVFVDNGSTDTTPRILKELCETFAPSIITNYPQPNYGAALRTGLNTCTSPWIHFIDVDQWDMPFFLWAWKNRTHFDIFLGSRRADPTLCKRPKLRVYLSWGLNAVLQLFFDFTGTETHGPKLINAEKLAPILGQCFLDRGQYDTEIVLRAIRGGFRIIEAPIEHEEKRSPRNRIFRKVATNLIALNRLRLVMNKTPWGKTVHMYRVSRDEVESQAVWGFVKEE